MNFHALVSGPEHRELVTTDDFASAIAQRWRDSVVTIIDVGKLLLGAEGGTAARGVRTHG